MPLECSHYKKCVYGRQCTPDCPEYSPFHCSRRDRSPGACNGCPNWSRCRFDKYQYSPEKAHRDYRTTLIDSREGVNLTVREAKQMTAVIAPLLKQGQSPYQIVTNHPELGISETAAEIPDDEIDFVLDRPFLFLVTGQDGSLLFSGVVRNIDGK